MKRAEQLREHARVLRVMATTLDISSIRDRLLNLSAMSEELASTIERAIKERQSAPIDITSKRPPPDIH
jgi:predicted RNase H-related nuclease YkuK (DUF458 family)